MGGVSNEEGAWHLKGGRTKWREMWAKCEGEDYHLSPHANKCQITWLEEGGRTTSHQSGLPPQGCTTSPRGAHLLNRHVPKLKTISLINCQSTWVCLLWPLAWLCAFIVSSILSPHVSLFLPLLIFIELKWLFWVFESKINFKWLKSLILLKQVGT